MLNKQDTIELDLSERKIKPKEDDNLKIFE